MSAVPLQSLWSVTAPPGPACAALSGARHAHAAIVGAGYTGLSAALHLAQAGRDVVVVEAGAIGARASGLNGGQVIPGVKHDPDALERLFGAAQGARLVATVAAGPDVVFELIEKHQLQCDAVRAGWIQPAHSQAALAQLALRVEQWRRRGAAVQLLSRAEVGRLTGSDCYCGGLIDRRGGTVQPLSYVRGLAAAVLRAGASIFTDSPAVKLTAGAGGWRIDTPHGSVTAPVAIIATNAYSGALHGPLRRSVVAVPSFQVATGPLPAPLRAQILAGGQAASDTRRLLRYFRLDAGGRFVLGARGSYAASPSRHAMRHHYRAALEIYPQLRGLPFEYHWGGFVAMTRDSLPHLHELAPGLLAGLGYNGRGVAMATVIGRLLARRALGAEAADLGFPLTPLRPVPLHALSGLGVRATVQYLRLVDVMAGGRARS
jgi:glycine/D-amino acid oxidase-like deaminating enzyme